MIKFCSIGLPSDSISNEHIQESVEDYEDDNTFNSGGASAYKSLTADHARKPKGGLKQALKVELDRVRRRSLGERALEKAFESHRAEVVRYVFIFQAHDMSNICQMILPFDDFSCALFVYLILNFQLINSVL